MDDIFSFFIIFPFSCKGRPTGVSAVPMTHLLCPSVNISLSEVISNNFIIRLQNAPMRGLCRPHQNPCPLTFHNLTPQGQNHSQSDHHGTATLCFPSPPPWFCHPFPSADTFRWFFLLNVLQISIFVSSLPAPTSSSCFVPLHSE